jgi:hypothetical protein
MVKFIIIEDKVGNKAYHRDGYDAFPDYESIDTTILNNKKFRKIVAATYRLNEKPEIVDNFISYRRPLFTIRTKIAKWAYIEDKNGDHSFFENRNDFGFTEEEMIRRMNKPMRKFRRGTVYQTSSYIKSEVTAIVSFLFIVYLFVQLLIL